MPVFEVVVGFLVEGPGCVDWVVVDGIGPELDFAAGFVVTGDEKWEARVLRDSFGGVGDLGGRGLIFVWDVEEDFSEGEVFGVGIFSPDGLVGDAKRDGWANMLCSD